MDAARLFVDFVERAGDGLDAGGFARGGERTGMGDDIGDAETVGSKELDDERVDGFLPELFVGAGKIDEIRIVGDRVGDFQVG